MKNTSPQPKRFLRLHEVLHLTGKSRSTLYSNISEGKFPEPVNLGGRSVGWIETEIIEWQEERIRASRS